jgi:hypothetical protein
LAEEPVILHDSVVMGDISVNQITTHVIECPNCGMQGVPVIRCAAPDCSDRFCYECERRWCSFRTRDQLPLCSPCFTKQQEANQKNKTTLSSLPENMRVRKRSEIDNSATAGNDGLSSGKLALMFVTCVFGSLIIGGTLFVLF